MQEENRKYVEKEVHNYVSKSKIVNICKKSDLQRNNIKHLKKMLIYFRNEYDWFLLHSERMSIIFFFHK